MAAYASVISLKHTINTLLNSCSSSREILGFAYDEATSLQQVLERLNGSSRSRSSMQIRDCANKLEDFLEFHELIVQKKQEEEDVEVRKEITSFVETAKKAANDYIVELSKDDDGDNDGDADVGDFGVEMVGHSTLFTNAREYLVDKMRPVDLCFYSFFGVLGSGRKIVAKAIYEDLCERGEEDFDCWAWVTVGHTKLKQVLISIISQVLEDEDEDDVGLDLESLSILELSNLLCRALEDLKYMIVMDDVEDAELVDYLKSFLPDEGNGSVVMFTTASNDVARLADTVNPFELPVGFFEETVWLPLSAWLFGFRPVPLEMEESGKKIIQNCRCSVIAAAKTFLFLLKSEKTAEQWRKIAADEDNPIFIVGDEVSEITKIQAEMQSWDMSDQTRRGIAQLISSWIGFSSGIDDIKMRMHPKRFLSRMEIISVVGMAGIGKSTFARKVIQDVSISRHFDHCVWITLGPKYQKEEILIDILAQIVPAGTKLRVKGDEILIGELCAQLLRKRCFIVLDDLCFRQPLIYLKAMFPNIMGTTLVTTRLAKVAEFGRDDTDMKMGLLDEEESWNLLCQKVFGGEPCSLELEKVGRMIAEKCDGLPLLILTVAEQLLKVEQSEEYWNNVASGKEKLVFKNAHHQISEKLLPSYQGLLQHLKSCFLYMGVFHEKFEILTSKLTNLWISEEFLEPNLQSIEEDFVEECLSELVDRSLLMVQQKVSDLQIKTCRLHSVFWHLSNGEAVKNKFFHAMNSYDDCSTETLERVRRLCIRNNILLGIKDVQNLISSNTSAHSLLCVGPFHQFPVPLNFSLRLLRVMDAISVRLYAFPVEVVRLIYLKFLGLTCNGELPTSISKLWKLQFFIVKRYMNIKSSQNSSHLPVEIWDMKELKHLEVTGGHLPNRESGRGLLKLTTLLDVSAESCRKKVLKWIPNLKRLSIQIELTPGGEGNPFRGLNRTSRLRILESLKCVVINPHLRSAPPPIPFSMFPRNLKKLSLSGLGYPWEYISIIGKLKNLEVLKLKHCAFIGPKRGLDHTSPFSKLKLLLIEDTDLVHWKVNSVTSMRLEHLCIRHCYKLQTLPFAFPIVPSTEIEIVDCSSSTVAWAKQMEQVHCDFEPKITLSWIANINQG